MASLEESFPRGGIQKKNKEIKVQKRSLEKDSLFDIYDDDDEEVKSKKKRKSKEDHEKPQKFKTEHKKSLSSDDTDLEILRFKDLSVGLLLLGCVKEVRDFEVLVSLPDGLTGFVQVTNISDAYTKLLNDQVDKEDALEGLTALPDLFPPGMLVRCAISALEKTVGGFNSVKLSVNPKDVNKALNSAALRAGMLLSGSVTSVEDHGYLIDIGVGGTKAFLPHKAAQNYVKMTSKGDDLKVGQYLNCLIEKVKDNGRIVQLSVNRADVATAIATEDQKWTLNNLLPGLVVKAKVQKVFLNGITVSFLSSFTGIVDFLHLDPNRSGGYQEEQMVKACIVCVHPSSKNIRLTLRQSLLQPGNLIRQLTSNQISRVVDQCTVKAYYKKMGAVFELDDESLAFAHISHLSDSKQSFKPEEFKKGCTRTGRVVDFSPMDEIALLSLRMHVIEAPFLRHQDILPGQLIEGKVTALKTFGMLVCVSDHLTGLVPSLHLADVLLKQPEKKYRIGNQIPCRVLTVFPEVKKLILTRKKTLIESKLPIIASYQDVKIGMTTHGFITSIKDFGCIVQFYNNVRGLVPKHELSTEPVPFPEKVFYEGQVMKVRVLNCDPGQERMLLSFKLKGDAEPGGGEGEQSPQGKKKISKYKTGMIADVKVLKKTEDGLTVSVLPDENQAFLPMMHLSDHITNCKLLWHWLQEGDVISRVMCLSDVKGLAIMCRKPSLISAVEEGLVVKNFSEVHLGMLLSGFVKNIMSYGVFVEFPYGLFGLAPKSAMSDKFVTDPGEHFVVGQSVVAKVTNIDEEKKRMLLSLKMSECASEDRCTESISLLDHYFQELQFLRSIMGSRDDSEVSLNLSRLLIGQKLKLTVQEVKDEGSVCFSGMQVTEGVSVTASQYHLAGKKVVPGQSVTAVVLHIDALKAEVHVSMRDEILKRKNATLDLNSTYQAVVQHVAEEVAVVSLVGTGQLTAIPVASHLNDTFRFASEKLRVRQMLSVTLKTSNVDQYGLLLGVQGPGKPRNNERERKKSESGERTFPTVKHSLCIGDIVTGTIKSVKPTTVIVSIKDKIIAFIHASEILEDVPIGSFPTSKLRVKQEVTARVIGGRDVKTHRFLPITHPGFIQTVPELSIRSSELEGDGSTTLTQGTQLAERLKSYKAGQKVTCFVFKYNRIKKCLEVEVSPDVRGRIEYLLLSLNPKVLKHPEKHFKLGQALSATVIGLDASETLLCLSLTGINSLVEGMITLGSVKKVNLGFGLTVALPFGRTGKAGLFDLSDSYSETPLENFNIGKIVRCFILSTGDDKIHVSLRQSRTIPASNPQVMDVEITSIEDIKKGQLLRGYVKTIKKEGMFFRLSSSIVGRIQYQYLSKFFVQDLSAYSKNIPEGKLLSAKVLSVQKKKHHVELSLLPEDTGKPDVLPKSLGFPLRKTEEQKEKEELYKKLKEKRKRRNSESEAEKKSITVKKKRKTLVSREEDDSGVEVFFREEEEEESEEDERKSKPKKRKQDAAPRLQMTAGFTWDVNLNTLKVAQMEKGGEESSDSDEEPQCKLKKKTKKEKEAEKQQAEKELCKVEATLMDSTCQPQTADDFDRLVLSSPNSSILWLQYMAFHLHATEIEKARAVAERALKTISFREEQEKLNVWVALLNLENMYGTEDTLMKVFERAVQYSEPLKVFQQLTDIYTQSEKYKEADGLYNTMLKRFRQEKSVWLKYATFLFKQGQTEAAHRLLQRALKCLPDKEHVDIISKFAQLEFHLGDVERAKAIFESTLSSYPKRTDLWSIYIDMMIKHGSQKEVRDIFERVIHLNLAAKRMKFFFKRYLEYEKKYGSPETAQAVKEKAIEYVESKSSLTES
ncbi:protein RRP5 homolog [Microcaecilia unicolor]|uniref:Protein RRP5 homolog n=1 Tax=Microcaecilia unicolor TaxID=1415580 RepID=A0A6P7Y0N0_9AMPH|nr:protein RRP5 homolog [Microcaecilia unicolor]XP_030058667.1 protein RRP5 homolog [Microcaecilia unicolor]